MNAFAEHLKTTNKSVRAFARDAGISATHCNKLLKGLSNPTVEMAAAIERASGGAVPISSWVTPSVKKYAEGSLACNADKDTRIKGGLLATAARKSQAAS